MPGGDRGPVRARPPGAHSARKRRPTSGVVQRRRAFVVIVLLLMLLLGFVLFRGSGGATPTPQANQTPGQDFSAGPAGPSHVSMPAAYLAWMPGGFPPGLRANVATLPGVAHSVVVAGDTRWMTRVARSRRQGPRPATAAVSDPDRRLRGGPALLLAVPAGRLPRGRHLNPGKREGRSWYDQREDPSPGPGRTHGLRLRERHRRSRRSRCPGGLERDAHLAQGGRGPRESSTIDTSWRRCPRTRATPLSSRSSSRC